MNENLSYINELVKVNLKLLVDDNIDEVLKYLTLKGYRITKPPKEIHDAYTFENAWNLYQKKVGDRARLNKKWNSMPMKDRKAATEYIPLYVMSTPDKQFRKNFQTFLNQRGWEDEVLGATPPPAITNEDSSSISQLIAKTRQETEDKNHALRQRIFGMIRLLQTNPSSLCKGQLEVYYRNGTLDRLHIDWRP